MSQIHIPVLLQEVIELLNITKGSVVVDGTMNTGGHSKAICKIIGSSGHLIGIDRDAEALIEAKKNLADVDSKVSFICGNYRNMNTYVQNLGIDKVDAVLLDVGLSSRQLDVTERGFTFQKDQPLIMTFESDETQVVHNAYDVVNTWTMASLTDIIKGFGDERFARRISRAIVVARNDKDIQTTKQLAEIIENAVPRAYKMGRSHAATKTFQAIRIAVNDEFGSLREGILGGIELLREGGRMAVISFHSGEDRIVKRLFREAKNEESVNVITKKPIVPTEDEVKNNKRSRSSKMRVIEKK